MRPQQKSAQGLIFLISFLLSLSLSHSLISHLQSSYISQCKYIHTYMDGAYVRICVSLLYVYFFSFLLCPKILNYNIVQSCYNFGPGCGYDEHMDEHPDGVSEEVS